MLYASQVGPLRPLAAPPPPRTPWVHAAYTYAVGPHHALHARCQALCPIGAAPSHHHNHTHAAMAASGCREPLGVDVLPGFNDHLRHLHAEPGAGSALHPIHSAQGGGGAGDNEGGSAWGTAEGKRERAWVIAKGADGLHARGAWGRHTSACCAQVMALCPANTMPSSMRCTAATAHRLFSTLLLLLRYPCHHAGQGNQAADQGASDALRARLEAAADERAAAAAMDADDDYDVHGDGAVMPYDLEGAAALEAAGSDAMVHVSVRASGEAGPKVGVRAGEPSMPALYLPCTCNGLFVCFIPPLVNDSGFIWLNIPALGWNRQLQGVGPPAGGRWPGAAQASRTIERRWW